MVRYDSNPEAFWHLKDNLGMNYIAELFAKENKYLSAVELTSNESTNINEEFDKDDENTKKSNLHDPNKILDSKALSEYKTSLDEIDENINIAKKHNDVAKLQKLERDKQFLINEIEKATIPYSGKIKNFKTPEAKASDAVNQAIWRARQEIEKKAKDKNDPINNFAKHLKLIKKDGLSFIYKPDRKMNWEL